MASTAFILSLRLSLLETPLIELILSFQHSRIRLQSERIKREGKCPNLSRDILFELVLIHEAHAEII